MSAIWGLLHLDDRPLFPHELQAVPAAMAHWGPDGAGCWCDHSVALGHLMLHTTPEALAERWPVVSPDGHLVLTAAARLDNREELCATLGVPGPERYRITDGQLLLLAYEKWGEASPVHLLGDWSFAVWDASRRRLFLARDHYGNTGVYYYYHDPRLFVFASAIQGLLAVARIPRRLHELHLARTLVVWPHNGAETLYAGMYRLPPAHCVIVTPEGISVRQYWRMEEAPEVRLTSNEAYVEAFLERYTRAVRCRLRTHRAVGTTLSAGLDSGSVTALAARELRTRGQTLTAFTSVPLHALPSASPRGRLLDEWPLAHATAEWCGNVEHIPIGAEQVTPLAGLRRSLCLHHLPEYAAGNLYWIVALLSAAAQRGIGVLLTGQCGNGGVSWVGDRYLVWRRLQQGQWRSAWQELAHRRAQSGLSWLSAMRGHILHPLLAPLRERYRLALRARAPWDAYALINPAFARRLHLLERMRADGCFRTVTRFVSHPRAERFATLLPGIMPVGALWHEKGAAYHLDIRDPTMDVRLLEFCLGIPDEQYTLNGQDRALMRRAMDGLLPPAVTWNRQRGLQGADIRQRLLASKDEVEDVLVRLRTSERVGSYLDCHKMQRFWSTVQRGSPAVLSLHAHVLMRGLLIGLFLVDTDLCP